jgi:chemotaxis protein MotB
MHARTGILLCTLALGAGGCVTKGTYEELQRDSEMARRRLTDEKEQQRRELVAERERVRTELQQQLDADRADFAKRSAESDAKQADLQARLDALDKQLDDIGRKMQAQDDLLSRERHKCAEALKHDSDLETQLAAAARDRAQLGESLEKTKAALAEAAAHKAEAERREAEYRALVDRFRKLVDAGTLRVKMAGDRMVVELGTDVLFPPGSAELSPEGLDAVSQVAKVLASIPERKFQVEGHTDNVPIHTDRYPSNWELAAARAISVVRRMIDEGMAPARISGATYAETRPAQSNETKDGRASNRRIEIVLVPDLSILPGAPAAG